MEYEECEIIHNSNSFHEGIHDMSQYV